MSGIAYISPAAKAVPGSGQTERSVFGYPTSEEEISRRARVVRDRAVAKASRKALLAWWPVVLGLFLACFAEDLKDVLISLGEWSSRFFMPMVVMAYQSHIGRIPFIDQTLPQIAMWLQFPLEGLIVKRLLRTGHSMRGVLLQVFLLHAVSTVIMWMLHVHGLR